MKLTNESRRRLDDDELAEVDDLIRMQLKRTNDAVHVLAQRTVDEAKEFHNKVCSDLSDECTAGFELLFTRRMEYLIDKEDL